MSAPPPSVGRVRGNVHDAISFAALQFNSCRPRRRGGNRHENHAAVAFEKTKPLTVTDVELDGPKAGEVLVEVKATGICHRTDVPKIVILSTRCALTTRVLQVE
jgi:hypothetical protein